MISSIGIIIAFVNLQTIKKQYKAQYERTCKEETIKFFHELKQRSHEIEKRIFADFGTKPINIEKIKDPDYFMEIKNFLSLLERFSLGVNTQIYDLNIADRLSGSYFINMYNQLNPFIQKIRKQRNDNRLYEEFEMMKISLGNLRKPNIESNGDLKHIPRL